MEMDECKSLRKCRRLELKRHDMDPNKSNCPVCNKPGNVEMVHCTMCSEWFHLKCSNATSETKYGDWICINCNDINLENQLDEKVENRSKRSGLSKCTERISLELQMLEEARLLQLKRDKKAQVLQTKRDEDYLQQKFSILMHGSENSSQLSLAESQQKRVRSWLHTTQAPLADHNVIVDSQYKQTPGSQSFYYEKPKVNIIPNTCGLTSNHLAARNSVSKDLPIFSGNPEDFPLFISCYEQSTNMCGFSNEENLLRLQKCLKGRALEAVRSRLLLPSNVPGIISTLRMIYGRPEIIIRTLLEKVRREPTPRQDKLESLVSYALAVQNLVSTMEAASLCAHLNNPMLLQELVDRLPAQIKLNWATHKRSLPFVGLTEFSAWMVQLAETVSDVTISTSLLSENKDFKRSKDKDWVNAHVEVDKRTNFKLRKCPICCQDCDSVENCKTFCGMKYNDKWNAVKEHRLCRTCLLPHQQSRCRKKKSCGTNGCVFKHHPQLHKPTAEMLNRSSSSSLPTENVHTPTDVVSYTCNTHWFHETIKYRIVPVNLYNKDTMVKAFAFLDEGSSLSMMEDSLANELKLEGIAQPLCLKWTGNTSRNENESKIVSVEISGTQFYNKKFNMPIIRTVKSMNLPKQSLDVNCLVKQYPYLKYYPIESYQNAVPRLLIGLDNLRLATPLRVIEGSEKDPVATKTRLGWVVYGSSLSNTESDDQAFHSFHKCECENKDGVLNDMLKNYFSLDSLEIVKPDKQIFTAEERRASQILATQTVRTGDRFETSLLWKYDDIHLPNSYPMALSRYICLRKKLKREPELYLNMKRQLDDYKAKGYIHKLSEDELLHDNPRTWYLPIFTVTNPNKPGKVRMVWDAAAEVKGISLNSMLLKGPDQLVPLLFVLYKFRERQFAICADIREMFHQVRVNKNDQHAQRFLWSDDLNKMPDIYVMEVLAFGASCSPSCAQFVKNLNAKDFVTRYPRAVTSILDRHYVDDLLDSVESEEEAISLAQDVRYIHKQGGFEIRNWISNSPKVIAALGEKQTAETHSLNISDERPTEKVLGMWWLTTSDCFTYVVSKKPSMAELLSSKCRPTKRQVLRVLMTVFDPLGLISHFTIYIKMLMQDIWRSKISWDEPINDVLYSKWCSWVKRLYNINQIKIPRCYVSEIHYGEQDTTQLHVFVDASMNAYAAVAYIRMVKGEHIECSLISSKARVAPLSSTTVPRLELEAARLGVRLATNIREGHTIQFREEYYWSDSKTVLSWIRSDQRNYRPFVSFRISEILESTNMLQWRYVPTHLNVADDATKWEKAPIFDSSSRWFNGPQFLMERERYWPPMLDDLPATPHEIRASVYVHQRKSSSHLINPERFSNWSKLVRCQAFINRFLFNIRAKLKGIAKQSDAYITKEEYLDAEISLYKQAQYDFFNEEIATLMLNANLKIEERKHLEKSSPLAKLSPYLDSNGALKIRGRIDAALGIPFSTKRPYILPKNHYITKLVIKFYHERYHHCNHDTAINEIRQKFYIPNLRVALKNVRASCQICLNQQARPQPPEMGDLPSARLSSFCQPFTYVGMDYFGPLHVMIGRRNEKRWGVLVTCLTTRAVHIEVANSLSADSCILAIKRFIARRGVPREIYCDNGTNFHGAEKELKLAIAEQQVILANEFSSSITKWLYNPPSSPHMGGSWERLVRSAKKVLYQILPTRNPSDELLHSMLTEVERVLNTRPLTYIPLDTEEDDVLTPNHFLLGSSNGEKPECTICDDSIVLRKNWLKSQQFANAFWRRWVREYLPTLTRRSKWFKPVKPIAEGDIVVIADDSNPRNQWPKGRVIEVRKGNDGQVRRAVVQTATGIYERPAVKLAVLDIKRVK